MAECKKCGKKFHACASCCLTNFWEYEYCSQECWESSDKYLNYVEKINKIFGNLPREYWDDLESIIADEDAYSIFDKIYNRRKT